MSSGFSENKGLWGLLSLAGSQNLPLVDLILYLPVVSAMNQWGGIKEKKRSSFGEGEEERGGKCVPSILSPHPFTNSSAGPLLAHPFLYPKKRLHYQNHLNVSFTALKLFDNFFNFDRTQAQCLHSFY